MKFGNLIIAIVVLAALTGGLYWSNHRAAAESTAGASSSTAPKILALDPADISAIKIKQKSGDEVVLTTGPTGQWTVAAPKVWDADQDAAGGILGTLSSLNADRVVEDKASDLKTFGLNQPTVEVDITEKNNKTQKLMIGDDTPFGDGAYAELEGDPRIFTVSGSVKTTLNKGAADLRDKRLLRISADQINKVEISAKKQDVEFVRDKDTWKIDKPSDVRTDSQRVSDFVQQLATATLDLSQGGGDSKTAATFASAAPVAKVTVTTAAGAQQLEVRKAKDDYYAKSSMVEGIYKVPTVLGQNVDKGLDDFRNRLIFDFGYETPDKIEMHDGTKSYLLTRTGQDWWENGKRMDLVSSLVFADKIRALPADKLVTSGFGAPAIDVTVTTSDGRNTEKVTLSKNGANYIAKRDGDPGLYEVSAQAVHDMEKAADDIKLAAAPPPGN